MTDTLLKLALAGAVLYVAYRVYQQYTGQSGTVTVAPVSPVPKPQDTTIACPAGGGTNPTGTCGGPGMGTGYYNGLGY